MSTKEDILYDIEFDKRLADNTIVEVYDIINIPLKEFKEGFTPTKIYDETRAVLSSFIDDFDLYVKSKGNAIEISFIGKIDTDFCDVGFFEMQIENLIFDLTE